jgi:uncharacterized protein YecE (DUF72 family)
MSERILIGTASWSDPGFVERWYPKKIAARDRLNWYAQHFELVEVNSTFYSVPDERTVVHWCASTPSKFTFDIKLHQLLSFHAATAKLLPPSLQRRGEIDPKGKVERSPQLVSELLKMFLQTISVLHRERKLGILLLQLSPAFSPRKHQLAELEPLIEQLADYRLAIEFRNRSWLVGEQLAATIDFLKSRQVIFANVDAPTKDHFTIVPSDLNEITNPASTYLRLHGRNAHAYLTGKTVAARFDYDYSDSEIAEVAGRAKRLAQEAGETHVIFNNNNLDYAPRAALRLRKLLGQELPSLPPQTATLL